MDDRSDMDRRRTDQDSTPAPTFHSAGGRLAATGLTAVLSGASAVVARMRTSGKPLHPRGAVFTGTLTRTGSSPLWGVEWLDGTGADEVLVRLSRSVGLPLGLPDVNGVAIRVGDPASGGDLLLSNTGIGRLTRFVLAPRRSVGGVHTTLLPYRTAAGPLLVRADLPTGPGGRRVDQVPLPMTMTLSAAALGGDWRPFGAVVLTGRRGPVADPPLNFDPIGNELPGLGNYPWPALLRSRTYASARAVRASRSRSR